MYNSVRCPSCIVHITPLLQGTAVRSDIVPNCVTVWSPKLWSWRRFFPYCPIFRSSIWPFPLQEACLASSVCHASLSTRDFQGLFLEQDRFT
ncbi:hypothetical protein CY34DRAFT_540538 [Suillus luteus UH-Slu-Lm8-n1]|uniref:Uncharacterized protein n=1 Tax=Suillus luteus UH-Slu-Lm8-n1 TaxID=930992 RepID=A0A0D0AUI2_9AGAM|nr:hypothetical protein CY34DRAFT_540538 [Suillus luteus UH-Slu-Lm8-n1]